MINLILQLVEDISEKIDWWNMQLKIHFPKTIARLGTYCLDCVPCQEVELPVHPTQQDVFHTPKPKLMAGYASTNVHDESSGGDYVQG
jgi:hypothetical protein